MNLGIIHGRLGVFAYSQGFIESTYEGSICYFYFLTGDRHMVSKDF